MQNHRDLVNKMLDELIEERKAQGLSQGDMAIKMRTVPSTISRLERKQKHTPNLSTLCLYANVLGKNLNLTLEDQ